jgi:hypothetical protein
MDAARLAQWARSSWPSGDSPLVHPGLDPEFASACWAPNGPAWAGAAQYGPSARWIPSNTGKTPTAPFPGARRVPASVRRPGGDGAGGGLAHALGCAGLDIPAHSSPYLLGRARLKGRLAKMAARRATHRRPQARRRGNQKGHTPVLSDGGAIQPAHARAYLELKRVAGSQKHMARR